MYHTLDLRILQMQTEFLCDCVDQHPRLSHTCKIYLQGL